MIRTLTRSLLLLTIFFGILASCSKKPDEPIDPDTDPNRIMATVQANGGLRIRRVPTLEGEKLGLIPDRTRVTVLEISAERITINGEEGNWTRVSWNDLDGWVFGAYLQFDQSNEKRHASLEKEAENFASPDSVEKASFATDEGIFSMGLGCTGRTYSEYESIIELDKGTITLVYDHLLEYGNPGESCSVTEQRKSEGEYTVEGNVITAKFTDETALVSKGVMPSCRETEQKSTHTEIDIVRKYKLVLCDNKNALKELNAPEELENMFYIDMKTLVE